MKIVQLIPATGPAFAVFAVWQNDGSPGLQDEVVQAWALYEDESVRAMVTITSGQLVTADSGAGFLAVVNNLPSDDDPVIQALAAAWFAENKE